MLCDDYTASCDNDLYQSKKRTDITESIHDYSEALCDTYNTTYNADIQSDIYLRSSTTSDYHEYI